MGETIYFVSLTARLERNMEFRPFVTAYRPVTRVGNWNEDLFLKAENDADFEERKARGQLRHQKIAALKERFLSEVVTSPHGDRVVSFGDVVMLKNLPLNKTVSLFSDNDLHWLVTGSPAESRFDETVSKSCRTVRAR